MKLYFSNTSPYSRKVRMVIIEKNLESQVEGVLVNPFENNADLEKVNPLGKIPALVLDNGETLFNSPLLVEYLDSLDDKNPLCPNDETKWTVLKWQALADGVLDATYNIVMETRREKQQQSTKWIKNWRQDIKRSLQEMENKIETLGSQTQLSHLAIATALGYLAFRQADLLPQKNAKLTIWYEQFKQTKAMLLTEPVE